MSTEIPSHGECPYCGVVVEFTARGNCSHESSNIKMVVALYECPNAKGACRRTHVVITNAGEWVRYPLPGVGDIEGVPELVMGAFREALLALHAGAPRAAATMIRRTVASAASDQGMPRRRTGGGCLWLKESIS